MTGAGAVASASKIIHNHSSSAPRQFHSIFLSDAGTGAAPRQFHSIFLSDAGTGASHDGNFVFKIYLHLFHRRIIYS
jgi:hypothetical protein